MSVAGMALLVLIITTAGLAIWDRSEEGGGGKIDRLVRIVAIDPDDCVMVSVCCLLVMLSMAS